MFCQAAKCCHESRNSVRLAQNAQIGVYYYESAWRPCVGSAIATMHTCGRFAQVRSARPENLQQCCLSADYDSYPTLTELPNPFYPHSFPANHAYCPSPRTSSFFCASVFSTRQSRPAAYLVYMLHIFPTSSWGRDNSLCGEISLFTIHWPNERLGGIRAR